MISATVDSRFWCVFVADKQVIVIRNQFLLALSVPVASGH